jgi:hypothetical protein
LVQINLKKFKKIKFLIFYIKKLKNNLYEEEFLRRLDAWAMTITSSSKTWLVRRHLENGHMLKCEVKIVGNWSDKGRQQ